MPSLRSAGYKVQLRGPHNPLDSEAPIPQARKEHLMLGDTGTRRNRYPSGHLVPTVLTF